MAPVTSPDGTGGPLFSVLREDRGATVVLRLGGELDMSGTDDLLAATAGIAPSSRVVLDLRELTFMDSSGLRVIMNLDVRARAEGWDLTLTAPRDEVRRLLMLCGVYERMTVTDAEPSR